MWWINETIFLTRRIGNEIKCTPITGTWGRFGAVRMDGCTTYRESKKRTPGSDMSGQQVRLYEADCWMWRASCWNMQNIRGDILWGWQTLFRNVRARIQWEASLELCGMSQNRTTDWDALATFQLTDVLEVSQSSCQVRMWSKFGPFGFSSGISRRKYWLASNKPRMSRNGSGRSCLSLGSVAMVKVCKVNCGGLCDRRQGNSTPGICHLWDCTLSILKTLPLPVCLVDTAEDSIDAVYS